MSECAIQLSQVNFAYDQQPVLKNINLDIQAGEFLGIVGPNAGGKSTLLKLILGLLTPLSGQIEILGQKPHKSRQLLGYVPQYPSFSRDFPINVEQTVLLGRLGFSGADSWRRRLGWYAADDRDAVKHALAEVEAGNLAKRQIGQLSGGQLQRVLLARALVSHPKVLILDEPTANIDQRMEGEIFDLLKRLNQRLTILVVSHDIGFISSYVSRVACINQTLICHHTDAINGATIQALYGEPVRMVAHHH